MLISPQVAYTSGPGLGLSRVYRDSSLSLTALSTCSSVAVRHIMAYNNLARYHDSGIVIRDKYGLRRLCTFKCEQGNAALTTLFS